MEGKKKKQQQSGSSFASDLFGPKKDQSAPHDSSYFGSVFPLPSNPSEAEKKSNQASQFHYNSSIFYGGRDDYTQPQPALNPAAQSLTTGTEIGVDEEGKASRGNWWQGSLYY